MKGRADIANFAIRAFLTRVGHNYDELRGFEPFKPTKNQLAKVVEMFDSSCCYCGKPLGSKSPTKDHLVPLNKASCGLHAWGNVVPSCSACNAEKHQRDWGEFLATKGSSIETKKRETRIRRFLTDHRYSPDVEQLKAIANHLYEDVGAVAMTLIDLRFKQASAVIRVTLGD